MDFINASVDVSTLPAFEEVVLQPVQPLYKKILRIEWMITTAVLVTIELVLLYFIGSLQQPAGWLTLTASVFFLSAIHWISIEKSFPWLAYAVRDKDVMFQKGWLNRSTRICPLNRIQNCTVQSGPLERKYRLASLIIYTAGAEGADLKIPGLQQQEADRLRHFILEKIHQEPDEIN